MHAEPQADKQADKQVDKQVDKQAEARAGAAADVAAEPGQLLVLALDTSTDELVCGLGSVSAPASGIPDAADKLQMLAQADHSCRRQANVELVNTVDTVLAQAGVQRAGLSCLVVGTGPGSFTGVRIGVAAAKGLALGLGLPLFGVSVLDAVAWHAWLSGVRGALGVVGDAMRREVYPGIYQLDATGVTRCFASETVCKVPESFAYLASSSAGKAIQLTGDGLAKYRSLYEEAGFGTILPGELWAPDSQGLLHAWLAQGGTARARAILAAGISTAAAAAAPDADADAGTDTVPNMSGDPALVLPVYTRLSDAEENERKRLGLAAPATTPLNGVNAALGNIHIQQRPMSVNDLPAVAALDQEIFGAGSPEGLGPSVWTQDMFADEYARPGSSWWVIHDQGQIVAYAGGVVIDGNLDILNVAVTPARRRQGLAQRLLAALSYDAQMLGATTATLEVEKTNQPALSLYTALGFKEAGIRRNYYGRGRDALTCKALLPLKLEHTDPHSRDSRQATDAGHLSASSAASKGASRDSCSSVSSCSSRPADTVRARKLEHAGVLLLAIESSCDETAMAVIDSSGTLHANVVSTQIDFHARFGGVVPEIASRKHTEAIAGVFAQAMEEAAASLGLDSPLTPQELSAVAVTQGPGLVGALVVGLSFAKGLAYAANKPLICVNHLEGHIYANLFETPDLEPPFITSLLSGGHTMLVHVRGWGDYEILGETLDDAVGEAFDKVAKALGLGYPGGPVISRLAATGNPRAIDFPRAMLHSHDYRFSLSGLKTAVITYINAANSAGRPINLPDLAASFEAAVIEVQVKKAAAAVKEYKVRHFCAGGGVTANPQLRAAYLRTFKKMGVAVSLPPLSACTDNAAMISLVALKKYQSKDFAALDVDADPNLELPQQSQKPQA